MSRPTVAVNLSSSSITTAEPLTVTVTVEQYTNTTWSNGTVTIASGAYSSIALTLSNGSASITIPAGSLAVNRYADGELHSATSTNNFYNAATGSATVTVTSVAKITPAVALTLSASNITTASVVGDVAVNGGTGTKCPPAQSRLPAQAIPRANGTDQWRRKHQRFGGFAAAGVDGLTVSYTPDSVSSPSITAHPVKLRYRDRCPKITPTIT